MNIITENSEYPKYQFDACILYIARMSSYLLLVMGINEHPLLSTIQWWCREQPIEEPDNEVQPCCISKLVQRVL